MDYFLPYLTHSVKMSEVLAPNQHRFMIKQKKIHSQTVIRVKNDNKRSK